MHDLIHNTFFLIIPFISPPQNRQSVSFCRFLLIKGTRLHGSTIFSFSFCNLFFVTVLVVPHSKVLPFVASNLLSFINFPLFISFITCNQRIVSDTIQKKPFAGKGKFICNVYFCVPLLFYWDRSLSRMPIQLFLLPILRW